MFLEIGRRRPPSSPADLLVECHGRIRHFLSIALRLSGLEPIPLNEVEEAAKRVRRYFAEALPLHVADEEELIAPLLLGKDATVSAALVRMADEHQRQQASLERVLEVCRVLAVTPEHLPDVRDELRVAGEALRSELIPHLEEEEHTVFPALARYLSGAEQDGIMVAMRLRRERHLEGGAVRRPVGGDRSPSLRVGPRKSEVTG